ncbi:MAG: amidohydrolase family protein [Planctomycetota bacterium]|nr:amidohydrolase family protein [Planctomycetota bacterium]
MTPPCQPTFVVHADRVLDPDSGRFVPRRIEVRDGTIVSVAPLEAGAEERAEVWDLRGMRILPPLADSHVHLYFEPWPLDPKARDLPAASATETDFAHARERLGEAFHAGVGVLRDLGDPLGISLTALEWTANAHDLPRLIASGPGLFREGRYGRFIGCPCADRASLLEQVRALLADPRVQLIKLVATGIINFKKGGVSAAPPWETDDLKAAVDMAHAAGKAVAAHGSGEAGIRRAVDAGVDFIEHGYFISKATMEELARRDLVWTPTFAPVHAQWSHAERCGWDAETQMRLRGILDGHAEMLRFARGLGARILAGSDAGSPGVGHGGGLWQELWLLQEAGSEPAALLRMATLQAAAWMGLGASCGQLRHGRPADFIAVDGPVEQDLRALERIRWVVRDGRVSAARKPWLESDPEAETYGLQPAHKEF